MKTFISSSVIQPAVNGEERRAVKLVNSSKTVGQLGVISAMMAGWTTNRPEEGSVLGTPLLLCHGGEASVLSSNSSSLTVLLPAL